MTLICTWNNIKKAYPYQIWIEIAMICMIIHTEYLKKENLSTILCFSPMIKCSWLQTKLNIQTDSVSLTDLITWIINNIQFDCISNWFLFNYDMKLKSIINYSSCWLPLVVGEIGTSIIRIESQNNKSVVKHKK